MYWDVIEVKPEPNHSLFVRFRDGVAGRVQLQPEELTGALAPLLDAQFFEQVYIDNGALAWPGEIDLAPDAMYRKIAGQDQGLMAQRPDKGIENSSFRICFQRLYELRDLTADREQPSAYFLDFEKQLKDRIARDSIEPWEKALAYLDESAWRNLKDKARPYLQSKKSKGRGWQQLFNILGEALAYRYLKEVERCSKVHFIPESATSRPDLEGVRNNEKLLCEVKTINISDNEVRVRRQPHSVRKGTDLLEEGFLSKLVRTISKAKAQLQDYHSDRDARQLVFLNVCFDDFFAFYQEDYLKQIKKYLLNHPPAIKVIVSLDNLKEDYHVVCEA